MCNPGRCVFSFWMILVLRDFQEGRSRVVPAEDVNYWKTLSQNAIRDTLAMTLNENIAQNVILFLGDGMSLATIMAARVHKGQKMGFRGEETWLSWERFPHSCLLKTYTTNSQVADSASSATAFLSGVKANYKTLGLSSAAHRKECSTTFGAEVDSIMDWTQWEEKDTGFVTTTRVTHATPAALYAHSVERYWESDDEIPANASRCKDIARQLVEDLPGRNIKVILGGGRRHFFPQDLKDPEEDAYYMRKDGRDLVKQWIKDKAGRNVTHAYVTNLQEFKEVDLNRTEYLLGLFSYSHMQYEIKRDYSPKGEPSLAEMTKAAITMLQKNPKGYFLLVEGGRIDHAHHDNMARHALEETLAMETAVQEALVLTSRKDTLVIVTADHSQVMTINGYAERGASILGLAGVSDIDYLPYTTLMYTNGPGYVNYTNGRRPNITELNTSDENYMQMALVPLVEETHGGEDVSLYAIGPMSHLFHGVQEQTYVAHAMAYASCVGSNKDHCYRAQAQQHTNNKSGSITVTLAWWCHVFALLFSAIAGSLNLVAVAHSTEMNI